MRKSILAILLFASFSGYTQTNDGVAVIKDPRLDLLIKKQVELNRQVYLQNNRTGAGYRVLVINTNNRSKAFEVKSRLMTLFPDYQTYLIYQSPYFKVQIGNFRDREGATELRKKILKYYPTGVIVVPSKVEYRQEDLEDLAN